MRRMYSEQELTKIIGEVFDAKIEAGAFDDSISDAVDAYLVEHPVDITALEGKTISPAIINATTSVNSPSGTFTQLQGENLSVSEKAGIFEKITDASGNYRFAGGELTENATTGVTHIYKKWSLSGTHLTIVDVIKIDNAAELPYYSVVANMTIPSWIGDKIYPIGTSGDWIVYKEAEVSKADGTKASENASILLRKLSNTGLQIYITNSITASQDLYVRLQFDLLIDN